MHLKVLVLNWFWAGLIQVHFRDSRYRRSRYSWQCIRGHVLPESLSLTDREPSLKKRNWLTIPCGLFYTPNLTLPPVCLELTGLLDLLVYVIFVLALWFFEDSKFCQGGSTGFFRGDTSQVWALTTSAWVNIWEKRLPQLNSIKMKIFYELGYIAIGVDMVT